MTVAGSTRGRIIDEALRLFAERGYAATSVAEIEAAAGLSPGAGGLYRHFTSKYEVLAAAVADHAARGRARIGVGLGAGGLGTRGLHAGVPLEVRLAVLCRAALATVREEISLTRVFFRDLGQFPELVIVVRDGVLGPLYNAIADWLRGQPDFAGTDHDWPAIGSVLGGAIVHHRLYQEILGGPAARAERERFVGIWVRLATGLVCPAARSRQDRVSVADARPVRSVTAAQPEG